MHNNTTLAQDGFNLIELLIISILVSILVFLASTDYSKITLKTQSYEFAKQLQYSLRLASRYAISLNETVRLCPSDDQKSCLNDINWAQGYLIMTHPTTEQKPSKILQYIPGTKNIRVHKNGTGISKIYFYISAKGYMQNTSFSVCNEANSRAFTHVVTYYSGRIRTDNKKSACF